MKINYHVLDNTIVLNFNGKTELVAREDSRFEEIICAIKEDRLDDIPEIVDSTKKYLEDKGLMVRDGLVYVNNEVLPSELNNRIIAFKEQGLPFKHLLMFWNNLKQNPSFNSRQMLFMFLEHNGHPITQDGCFIAYRGVTEDFKDNHTRTFDNKPGSVCSIPRDQVDDNPNNTCSKGLHVACFDYAKGFGARLVEVKVNPKNVVCVPTDYNGTKMRVCEFEVIQECEKPRDEQLYDYDPDEYVEEDRQEMVDDFYQENEAGHCECCTDGCDLSGYGCDDNNLEYSPPEIEVENEPEWNDNEDYQDESYDEEPEEISDGGDVDDLNPDNVRFEKKVDSSVIAKIEYRGTTLTVDLKNKKRYRYFKVPYQIALDFLYADSVGSYYNTEIKGVYDSKKIA